MAGKNRASEKEKGFAPASGFARGRGTARGGEKLAEATGDFAQECGDVSE